MALVLYSTGRWRMGWLELADDDTLTVGRRKRPWSKAVEEEVLPPEEILQSFLKWEYGMAGGVWGLNRRSHRYSDWQHDITVRFPYSRLAEFEAIHERLQAMTNARWH